MCEYCNIFFKLCKKFVVKYSYLCKIILKKPGTKQMKSLKLVVVGLMLIFAGTAMGQISVNVHIGTPPSWGPAGYNSVKYYYLPDVEAYYDVQNSMFIYMVGNSWVHRSYLPARYKNYDLYRGYKVVMNDYRGNTPYTNFKSYKVKYAKGYRGKSQRNIGIRNDRNNHQVKSQTVIKVEKTVNRNNNSRIQVKDNNKGNKKGNNNVNKQSNNKANQNNNKGQSGSKNQKDNRNKENDNRK